MYTQNYTEKPRSHRATTIIIHQMYTQNYTEKPRSHRSILDQHFNCFKSIQNLKNCHNAFYSTIVTSYHTLLRATTIIIHQMYTQNYTEKPRSHRGILDQHFNCFRSIQNLKNCHNAFYSTIVTSYHTLLKAKDIRIITRNYTDWRSKE